MSLMGRVAMHISRSGSEELFKVGVIALLCIASSLAYTQSTGKINGRFAYGIASDSRLSIYAIDEATGNVRSLGYIPAEGRNAASLALDPQNRFVYVANNGSNNVAVFRVKNNGALTWRGNFRAGTGPIAVTADPSGEFVYVANRVSNDVSGFTVNASTGRLTSVGANVLAGSGPTSVTVDPSGRFVYVTNGTSNDISIYRITSITGTLTQV